MNRVSHQSLLGFENAKEKTHSWHLIPVAPPPPPSISFTLFESRQTHMAKHTEAYATAALLADRERGLAIKAPTKKKRDPAITATQKKR